ncbi:hypothetical protein H8959_002953 [Pygathrix nigripes]
MAHQQQASLPPPCLEQEFQQEGHSLQHHLTRRSKWDWTAGPDTAPQSLKLMVRQPQEVVVGERTRAGAVGRGHSGATQPVWDPPKIPLMKIKSIRENLRENDMLKDYLEKYPSGLAYKFLDQYQDNGISLEPMRNYLDPGVVVRACHPSYSGG